MNIVKIPDAIGSMDKNKGCEKAPDAILRDVNAIRVEITGNEDENLKKIEKTEGYIFLGGSHSITYGLFKGMKGNNKGLLIFDAHVDADFYTNTVTHEDFVRKLVEEGSLKKENLIYVGVRKIYNNELKFLKENKIKYFDMDKIFDLGVKEACDCVMESCRDFSDLHVSIDIDVLDPSCAPGTGYLESGGLLSRELFYFLKRLKLLKNLRRADIVEVNPDKDVNEITVKTARKILEILK